MTGLRSRSKHFDRLLAIGVVVGCVALTAANAWAQQEEEEDRPLPGLLATYRVDGQEYPVLARYEALPAMLLKAGETPDPRLADSGWTADWQGLIEILRPGQYAFAARASGKLEVNIGGQSVLAVSAPKGKVIDSAGQPVTLKFGLHPIVVRFQPSAAGPSLKLFWQAESFAREPLPAFVLGHAKSGVAVADAFATGRLNVEEHSCTACHLPGDHALAQSLLTRPGPHLSGAGSRLKAAWIYHWLGDPQSLRPEAVMPKLFASGPTADLERYAAATFLASLGKPPAEDRPLPKAQHAQLLAEGQQLFQQTGCVVCHEKQGAVPARATLAHLGQKTTASRLAAFIKSPAETDPAGRMPGFDLRDEDIQRLAIYLTSHDAATSPKLVLPAAPRPAELRDALLGKNPTASAVLEFGALSADEHLHALGRRVLQSKRCTNCHELKIAGESDVAWKPRPAEHTFAAIANKPNGGCLADVQNRDAKTQARDVPQFGGSLDRAVAATFLAAAAKAPGTIAPGELARLTLARFNCTGCHQRDGQGGLSPQVVERLLANQTEQNAEMVSPPPLTGVTDKLLGTYIHKVLLDDLRSRPWMALKMPRFARAHVEQLPAGLAALEGEPVNTKAFRPPADDALAEAGRVLVGIKGFGCTKCHDMLGVASQGTRGPELSFVPARVNYDWYVRWMTDPQRIQPGTRMPTVFLSGESPHKQILEGDPAKQQLAVWHYLAKSRSLPPPDGLQTPTIQDVLNSERPLVVRTFMPGVSPRGLAIRGPNGVHVAYDAQACRVAYAWQGEFLNLSPAWEGRGGMKAGLKTPAFWTSPDGFPWDVTEATTSPPDFSGRGKDTSLGAELPHDGKLHPSRLDFHGYSTGASGPRFKFELQLPDGQTASFDETVSGLKTEHAQGLVREATVKAPAGRAVWLNVATADKPPTWGDGGPAQVQAVLHLVVQGKPLLLHLRSGSPGAVWHTAEQNGKWNVMLSVPTAGQPAEARVKLAVLKSLDEKPATVEQAATWEAIQK